MTDNRNLPLAKDNPYPVSEKRSLKFADSIERFSRHDYKRNSIGILQEKTIHSVVKDFYAEKEEYKEIPVNGYVADICNGHDIIEIQTAGFGRLREKLAAFLPGHHVTIVYPMQYQKWVVWIDPDTGELVKRNKSNITGSPLMAFKELYRIKTFLCHPDVSIILTMIDYDEYRYLNGWSKDRKHGSHRYDRFPIGLRREYVLESPEDYKAIISGYISDGQLNEHFLCTELAKAAKVRRTYASFAINVLSYMNILFSEEKNGRAKLYKLTDGNNFKISTDTYTMLQKLHIKKGDTDKMSKNVIDRFLTYVKFDTQSDEKTNTSPSTMKQHKLAALLAEELEEIGAEDVFYDKEHCYVYCSIPSNTSKKCAAIGFIAHIDTADAVTGENVKPAIIKNYAGKDIVLNKKDKITMSVKDFPELENHIGEDLIVTDGTTLLGADDKAGVSEIMSMAQYLTSHPEVKHGKICICFTADEEIGEGTKYFDLKRFGADFAYTVDGGKLGELEYENFNAAEAELIINGRSTHPGDAKNKMLNATLIAYEFQSMLPVFDNPMYTEGREGFFHLILMKGTCEKAVVYYIIRDHDKDKFDEKKVRFRKIVDYLNDKYGQNTIELTLEDSYYNMIDKIKPHMHLIENARKAMEENDVIPVENPIRGGTDGAALSFKGLPCPNLCTGGYNYHSRFEFASIQEMEKVVDILVSIVKIYGSFGIPADMKKASGKAEAKAESKTATKSVTKKASKSR